MRQATKRIPNTTVANVMEVEAIAGSPAMLIDAAKIAIRAKTIIQPSIFKVSVGREVLVLVPQNN
jgi:hypothetical protein